MKKDFHNIALHSRLFKGRSNWYFCYLKSEKLAQVLALLAGRSVSESAGALKGTVNFAGQIVQDVVHAAAGEVLEETLLADLFSMISTLRLQALRGHLDRETAQVLVEEYEGLVERLVGESRHLGLSVSPEDLSVPSFQEERSPFSSLPYPSGVSGRQEDIKDIDKGQGGHKGQIPLKDAQGQSRSEAILDFVRKSNGVSIKDIARVVRGCSDKTIQRELNTMIERGVIVREGERRWSTYKAV